MISPKSSLQDGHHKHMRLGIEIYAIFVYTFCDLGKQALV